MEKKILVVTSHQFPFGTSAGCNRIWTYCKKLAEEGGQILVISLSENPNKDKSDNGIVNGIEYKYLFNSGLSVKSKIRYLLNYIKLIYKHSFDIVIYYSEKSIFLSILHIFRFFRRFLILKEQNEDINLTMSKMNLNKLNRYLYFNTHFRCSDAVIVISSFLKRELENKKINTILIPITVDLTRFENKKNLSRNNIVYCGTITRFKDGVDILMNAINQMSLDNNNLFFKIIGDVDPREGTKEDFISLLEPKKREYVSFLGNLPRDEVATHLLNAAAAVLPRPDNIQSNAGLPTKVAEYLACKTPVILTRTSDLPKYLEDKKSCLFIEHNNPNDLAEKIMFIIENPKVANQIGINGYYVCKNSFSYDKAVEPLKQYIVGG